MKPVTICLAITLLAAVMVTVQGVSRLYWGSEEPTNYVEETLVYFDYVNLYCRQRQIIHINSLEISLKQRLDPSQVEKCNDTSSLTAPCQGRNPYCFMNLTASGCRYHNHLNITFQCRTIYSGMYACQDRTINSTASQLGYLFTPGFTYPYNPRYQNSLSCECTATPSIGSAVSIEVLYANLETIDEGGCYDYLRIDSGERVCSVNKDSIETLTYSYAIDYSVPIQFYSDMSIIERGAWIVFHPDSPNGTVQITCTENTFVTSTTPAPQVLTFRGEEEPTNFSGCTEAKCIDKVELVCDSDKVIHITKLDLSHSSANCTMSSTCSWVTYQPIKSCEGKESCQFDVCSRVPSYCRHINKIDITFQCIPIERVYSMCPTTTSVVSHNQTVYYSTPRFTEADGVYPKGSSCQCIVKSSNNNSVTAKLLFADLEMSYMGPCNDYVGFDINDAIQKEHCNETFLKRLIYRDLTNDVKSGFQFFSRYFRGGRGAWFALYPGNGTAMVTCNNYIGTTTTTDVVITETTHIYQRSTGSSSSTLSTPIVVVIAASVGGAVLLLVLVSVVVVCIRMNSGGPGTSKFSFSSNPHTIAYHNGDDAVTDFSGGNGTSTSAGDS